MSEYTYIVIGILALIVLYKVGMIIIHWSEFKQNIQSNINMIKAKQDLEKRNKNN